MAEQYDSVGSKYEQFKNTATLPIPERHTFLRLVGNLEGKSVLDLACGSGHYSRLLKDHGAERVEGVDISPEMVQVARQKEQEQRRGVLYHVFDAAALPRLGDFDLVTAVYLLNYARTRDDMLRMCRSAFSNLKEGGRCIAFTIDPAFDLRRSNWAEYGFEVRSERFEEGRYVCEARFSTAPSTPVEYFRWSTQVYESVLAEAGFRQVAWHPFEIPAEALEKYGEAYWREYRENPLLIALSGRK
ncbi:class I SAM-dependent methyltransferase [Archangium violaceum]|uniref:class I SAM-dependent methyltransferase n=1 Tax=Archangium violaceum TaxID=83451 RepID=UPI00193AF75E|nr:class I SAM-dependent methyltransferase [Archangium violaceum]QRK07919.1 class I SAM-dependent methyltransferase [Archangium violaceum]